MSTRYETVGFDAATGAVRWSREGPDTYCDIDVTLEGGIDVDPLLAGQWQSGQMTVHRAIREAIHDKPAMALTVLDVATGQSRWTAPIGEIVLSQKEGIR